MGKHPSNLLITPRNKKKGGNSHQTRKFLGDGAILLFYGAARSGVKAALGVLSRGRYRRSQTYSCTAHRVCVRVCVEGEGVARESTFKLDHLLSSERTDTADVNSMYI